MDKRITIALVSLAVIVGGVLLVLSQTIWKAPTHEDYEAARKTMNGMNAKYTQLGKSLSSLSDKAKIGESDLSKERAAFESDFEAYKKEAETLASSRVLNDKDVKTAYDSFKVKNDEMISFTEGVAGAMDEMSATVRDCPKGGGMVAAVNADGIKETRAKFDQILVPCQKAYAALGKTDNKQLARLGQKFDEIFASMDTKLDEMVAAEGDSARSESLKAEMKTITDRFAAETKLYENDYQSAVDSVRINKSAQVLVEALRSKL